MKYKRNEEILGYKILKEIGNGGMSEVYIAVNKKYNRFNINNNYRYVVIKIIQKDVPKLNNEAELKEIDDKWKKAIDEYKITWSVYEKNNPNVIKPIEWKIRENEIIIVSEYIDGLTLNEYLDRYKLFNVNRAIFYFKQILNGTKLFHKINNNRLIIHRDLKPENIIFTSDLNTIKIIDYGIASCFYDNNIDSAEGTIYCTADYTTPDVLELKPQLIKEVFSNNLEAIKKFNDVLTVQFDFHSLGVILYYMLTGELPFKYDKANTKDINIIKMWLKYDLPYISSLPNSLQNIIFRCTASKPEDKKYRYSDIDQIINDVNNWEINLNEPLLKPIEKRVFQQSSEIFNIEKEKQKETFLQKWWFFILVTTICILIIITIVITLLVV